MKKAFIAIALLASIGITGCSRYEEPKPADPVTQPLAIPQEKTAEQKHKEELIAALPTIYAKAIKNKGFNHGAKIGDLVIDQNYAQYGKNHYVIEITYDINTLFSEGFNTRQQLNGLGKLNAEMLVESLIQELINAGYNPRTEKIDLAVETKIIGLKSATGADKTGWIGSSKYSYDLDKITTYDADTKFF